MIFRKSQIMYLLHLDLSNSRRYTTDQASISPTDQTVCTAILNSSASAPYAVSPTIKIYVAKQTSKYLLLDMTHQAALSGSLKIAICRHSYGKPPAWAWLQRDDEAPPSVPFAARCIIPTDADGDWYAQHQKEIDALINTLAWHWLTTRYKKD